MMDDKTDTLGQAVNRALFADDCRRLSEWALIGPVQRAELESFAERLLEAGRELLEADAKRYRLIREMTEQGDVLLWMKGGAELDAKVDSRIAKRQTHAAGNSQQW